MPSMGHNVYDYSMSIGEWWVIRAHSVAFVLISMVTISLYSYLKNHYWSKSPFAQQTVPHSEFRPLLWTSDGAVHHLSVPHGLSEDHCICSARALHLVSSYVKLLEDHCVLVSAIINSLTTSSTLHGLDPQPTPCLCTTV